MGDVRTKSNFAVLNKYEAFLTDGNVQFSNDGTHMFCICDAQINVLEVSSGKRIQALGKEEDDGITSFALSSDDKHLIVASKNLLLRQWDWKENVINRSWKAVHNAPILVMTFDPTSSLLATGSADSTIKIWDVIQRYYTHNLKGHSGVITAVKFHPDMSRPQVVSAAQDYKIRVWDLQRSSCLAVLEGHMSAITELTFSTDGSTMFSAGRDSVVISWDAKKLTQLKTVPVFEPIEWVSVLPNDREFPELGITGNEGQDSHFITAGSEGVLKVWNASNGRCVFKQVGKDMKEEHGIVRATYCAALDTVNAVTFELNVLIYKLQDLTLQKQLAGNNDEILDMCYLGDDTHIVVATNSSQIKVFEVATWDCQILRGHSDTVLSLDTYNKGQLLVTSSKDNNVRVWKLNPETKKVTCVAIGYGHTHSVSSVAFTSLSSGHVVSGSVDCTIKVWRVPEDLDSESSSAVSLTAELTEKAHDKDISSITVSPNDKLIATGSMDKTAKLWRMSDLSLLGVFRGHKRGIWCVKFSPVDQVLATASGDSNIKIWALSDFSCVKTFEGHESAVLRVNFISRGMQIVSSGSDGLVKLWTIKNSECVKTFDEHEGKVWALTTNSTEEHVVTGADDSSIIIWKDVTEDELEAARLKEEDLILKVQQLSNLIQQKKYLKAIGLAITLEQPFRVLNIFKEILNDTDGKKELEATLIKLRMDQIDALLRFSVSWNMNSKHCHEAQYVIGVILRTYRPDELMALPNIKSSIEGLVPYTDRHYQRMKRLQQQTTFLDYSWQCMKMTSTMLPSEPNLFTGVTLDDGDTQGFYIDSQGSAGPADDVKSEGEQSDAENESMEIEGNKESAERELDAQNSHEGSMPTKDSKDEEEDEEEEEVEEDEEDEEEVLESPQPSTKKRKIGHTDFKENEPEVSGTPNVKKGNRAEKAASIQKTPKGNKKQSKKVQTPKSEADETTQKKGKQTKKSAVEPSTPDLKPNLKKSAFSGKKHLQEERTAYSEKVARVKSKTKNKRRQSSA